MLEEVRQDLGEHPLKFLLAYSKSPIPSPESLLFLKESLFILLCGGPYTRMQSLVYVTRSRSFWTEHSSYLSFVLFINMIIYSTCITLAFLSNIVSVAISHSQKLTSYTLLLKWKASEYHVTEAAFDLVPNA